MRLSLDIQPRYIEDPIERKFWEVVKGNFQELSAGLATVVPAGNSPVPEIYIPDLSNYLFLPGRVGGQTIQSLAAAENTLTIKTFASQTGAILRFVDSTDTRYFQVVPEVGGNRITMTLGRASTEEQMQIGVITTSNFIKSDALSIGGLSASAAPTMSIIANDIN